MLDSTAMGKLKKARKRQKLSQAALAKKAGLSQGQIAHLESGTRMGQIRTWKKVADALNVSIADLI